MIEITLKATKLEEMQAKISDLYEKFCSKDTENPKQSKKPQPAPVKNTTAEPTIPVATEQTPQFEDLMPTIMPLAKKVAKKIGNAETKKIISSFGVEKLTDVPEERHAELLEKLETAYAEDDPF